MEREKKIQKEIPERALFNKMEIVKAFYSNKEGVQDKVKDRVVQAVSKIRTKLALDEEKKRDKIIEL